MAEVSRVTKHCKVFDVKKLKEGAYLKKTPSKSKQQTKTQAK
jgi:hypothetical protein